jgi:hypothetical protein
LVQIWHVVARIGYWYGGAALSAQTRWSEWEYNRQMMNRLLNHPGKRIHR